MKKYIYTFLILFIFLRLTGQENNSISGFIYDKQTNYPIENTELFLRDIEVGATSDKNGFFSFQNVKPGSYQININHIGYWSITKKVLLEEGNPLELNYYLTLKAIDLEEIIVSEESEKDLIISKLPYIETKVFKKQISESAASDITDFLKLSNNIGGIRKGGTQLDPVVRGLKYSQLNVQINSGQKIEGACPNRMDPATAHVDIDDIETIEVFKGPYALKYGPSFGGVINMKTKSNDNTDTLHIGIDAMTGFVSNWNGYKNQIRIYGGNKFAFFNLSGGRKDYGNYKDGNGNEINSEFQKYYYGGKLGIRPFKNHTLIINFEDSKGRDVSFPGLRMDERSDDTRLISLDYTAKSISKSIKAISGKIYNSDVDHEMDNKNRPFSDTVVAISNINAINRGGRVQIDLSTWKGILSIGTDFEQIMKDGIRSKYMIKQPGLPIKNDTLWNNGLINNYGIFCEYVMTIRTWEIIVATRFDLNEAKSDDISISHPKQGNIYKYGLDSIQSNYSNFSFSMGFSKKFNTAFSLSFALGRGVRSPDMTERYIALLPIGYDNYDYLGNPQLKPETNNQADLTLKYANNIGLLQFNIFYALINNYISGKLLPPSQQKPLSNGVAGVKQFYNNGNAKLKGIELSLALPLEHNLGINLLLSYTNGTIDQTIVYESNNSGEIVDSKEVKNDAMSEIPPFELVSIFKYSLFKNRLLPKLTVRIVGNQNHVSESQFEKTTPGFFVTNFSLFFKFNKYLNISTGVNNIFNNSYYEHLNRNIIGTQTSLYEPGRIYYMNLMFKI